MSEITNPPPKKSLKKWIIALIVGYVIFMTFGLSTCNRLLPTSKKQEDLTQKLELSESKASNEPYKSPLNGYWIHSLQADPISNKEVRIASIQSKYPLNFSFPYQGEQYAKLSIRRHPRYGLNVFLEIEKGQFMAGVRGVTVNARFDKETTTFQAEGPEDNSSTTLFLKNEAKFLSLLTKSKLLFLSTPVYQEGEQIMVFNIENFNAKPFQK